MNTGNLVFGYPSIELRAGTQRQLTDAAGEVTYAARYTPWGDTLDTYGTGNFAFGYFGGLMDNATGLLYVGDGQYYDPQTGRFLTRGSNPNSPNPYLPFDPTGAMFGPLGLLAVLLGRRKKKSKYDILLFMVAFAVVTGVALSACGGGGTSDDPEQVEQPPTGTPTPGGGSGDNAPPTPIGTPPPPAETPVVPCPEPENWYADVFLITHYTMPMESDPFFDKGSDILYDEESEKNIFNYLRYSPNSSDWADPYVNVKIYNPATNQIEYHRHIYDFVYNLPYGVAKQGTGITKDNQYISIDYNRSNIFGSVDELTFVYKEGGSCGLHQVAWATVASQDSRFACGDKVTIEAYPGIIFTVTDTGSQLKESGQLDVFVGAMRWSEYYTQFPSGNDKINARVGKVQ